MDAYQGEEIGICGAAFADSNKTQPVDLTDKRVTIYIIKRSNDQLFKTITDNDLVKQGNTWAFVLSGEETTRMSGGYTLQVNIQYPESAPIKAITEKVVLTIKNAR